MNNLNNLTIRYLSLIGDIFEKYRKVKQNLVKMKDYNFLRINLASWSSMSEFFIKIKILNVTKNLFDWRNISEMFYFC